MTLRPPLHSTELYAAAVVGLAVASWIARRKRFQGEVFFGTLLFYGGARLAIDALRGDLGGETLFFSPLPATQLFNAFFGLAGVLGLACLLWHFKRAGLSAPVV